MQPFGGLHGTARRGRPVRTGFAPPRDRDATNRVRLAQAAAGEYRLDLRPAWEGSVPTAFERLVTKSARLDVVYRRRGAAEERRSVLGLARGDDLGDAPH